MYNAGPFQGRWTYSRLKTGMEPLQGEALGFMLRHDLKSISRMNEHIAMWLLVAAGLTLAACETILSNVLEKNAQGDELRKETMVGVPLPPGCPTLTTILPAEKTSVAVYYQEPTTTQAGNPLANLAYTTIYLSWPNAQPKAIRIWTNDAHGGALVTVRDIPVAAQELGLCVTATNWGRQESPPAPPTKPKP